MFTPLTQKHAIIIGRNASDRQLRLYANFPEYRGFSSIDRDRTVLDAILVLALNFGDITNKVTIFVPPLYEKWVLAQLSDLADGIFDRCKKSPNSVAIAKAYAMMFGKIFICGHPLRFEDPPPYWVSFGFTKDASIPKWMQKRLLETSKGG